MDGKERPWEPVEFEQLLKDAQDLSKQNLDNIICCYR